MDRDRTDADLLDSEPDPRSINCDVFGPAAEARRRAGLLSNILFVNTFSEDNLNLIVFVETEKTENCLLRRKRLNKGFD